VSLTLYAYWRSSASWRVRIGLQLKDVPHQIVPVHLVRDGGEHRMDAHTARNPLQQVPVLEVSGGEDGGPPLRLTQSLAILTWLDAVYPEPALWPADPVARAHAVELAEIVNAGIQPLQNLSLLQTMERLGADKIAWGREVIDKGLRAMASRASGVAGRFMVGDEVSIADVCLVPQLYNARRFGVDLSDMPLLTRVEAACEALPAFAAAHPDRQPDAAPT